MWTGVLVAFAAALAAVTSAFPQRRQSDDPSGYEYIVVGSGAGGGPLASRLARAGFKTLLLEAGDDQGSNLNTSVPGYQAVVTQDPKIRWDMYVNHYQDIARAQLDPKFVYDVDGAVFTTIYNGTDVPAGATPKGILYPRAGVLGGCVSHNALIWIEPHDSDWNNIQNLTGDSSWSAENMRDTYLNKRVYQWQSTEPTDPTIVARDVKLAKHLVGGAAEIGLGPNPLNALTGLGELLLVSPNGGYADRDSTEGFFQIPLIMTNGARKSVRDWIVETVNDGYPLTVMPNTFVTKITFDTNSTSGKPRATGVEYLQGQYLYTASPLSGGSGTPGSVSATREVIVSGGTYNTPQLLKLSGVGPADELESFDIPVLVDLPGLGSNMQDRYEIPINTYHPDDFTILDGCTFDLKSDDKCLTQWENNPYVLAQKGAYATNGLAAAMGKVSSTSPTGDVDLFIFGGPVNFQGYFPQWSDDAVKDHQHFSWYTLKAHTQNKAGTVTLRSTNPLDQPDINFNYFDTGTTASGEDEADLASLVEAVKISRGALQHFHDYDLLLPTTDFTEEEPGKNVTSDADIGDYIKQRAWGHHACCTAPIGADDDPSAVLDTNFRVKGTEGLRVVDASVFPRIPGIFIQSAIFMISEKAADAIINGS
ncbi:hypothetical protein BAUCODRAFT_28987 [Baudoinia panamericana UAMH 10762]|uniref:Glucose-methanol-choline oxidoreductase N-terminal domain-containing protein n=1 Tax=Baudoinia panamericana (strain UAMH 10762) TaxID=717646 RepID=M2N911_BAUPA|nr:uncharacterized protein BAUCODRAFT_28987 [Baudoinia panamericana UAMH 10762]EMD00644.1 hypothetical protein BAUCODRAFT_28987 [Baudoinia panamericana UAMH 10762]